MSRTQEWQIKTLFHNNFSKLVITNLLNKFFLSTTNDAICESAETSNSSGNDFRQARKCQTFKKVICGRPANIKSFKKLFAGGPQAQNLLKSDLREARKHQIL